MSVLLFNKDRLDLPKFHKHNDRIEFVMSEILDNEPYLGYYNLFSKELDLSESEHDKIVDRWLGVKTTGKPDTDDSTKHLIDYLSGYILNARELKIKDLSKEYVDLITKDILSDKEIDKLDEISKAVLYSDINNQYKNRSIVFIENTSAETSMKKRLNELEYLDNKSYSEKFIYDDIDNRLKKCSDIKKKVLDLSDDIEYNIIKIREIEKVISIESNKDLLDKSDVDFILGDVKKVSECRDKIRDNKFKIRQLIEDYAVNTEMFTAAR